MRLPPDWVGKALVWERESGGNCGYLLASAGFHRLPGWAGTREKGSRSLMNLLRAGRTQARALFAGREGGPAPKCSPKGSRKMPGSAADRSAGAGREGTEFPAQGASGSAASRARQGRRLGESCPGSGQRLGDCKATERLESQQVCSGHHASQARAATCGKASR